ncbi:MAG TPA: FAD-linked oxidase C-terminal domain-containing protein, partial [Gemmatimonadales bacterium]|nr:FAD-linked oxidase C-terminal domain-containing protein [Gemmatimonadales bacterium]
PPARAALGVALADLGAAADLVAALLPFAPSALELLDRTFLDLTGDAAPPGAEALLLVELEGEDAAALRAVVERAALAARPFARVVETALTPAEEERLWAIRHAASPILASLPEDRRSLQVIEDGCVPVARLGEYVRFLRRATRARGVDAVIFGHAGDGNVHVNLLPEVARPGWEAPVAALLDEVTEAVVRLGGTISGEHGDGRLRAPYLERQYGSEVVELFRRVKRAFDPHAILNPGIKLPSTRHDADAAPLARLKAGAGAAPLPDDIAAALREIERRGGYARDRLELADRGPRPAP